MWLKFDRETCVDLFCFIPILNELNIRLKRTTLGLLYIMTWSRPLLMFLHSNNIALAPLHLIFIYLLKELSPS
jgi:hypothetical protein